MRIEIRGIDWHLDKVPCKDCGSLNDIHHGGIHAQKMLEGIVGRIESGLSAIPDDLSIIGCGEKGIDSLTLKFLESMVRPFESNSKTEKAPF